MWWFKRGKDIDLELRAHQEENTIKHLNNDALLKEFQESLEDYQRGVEANWKLTIPDIDDASSVVSIRDYLHNLYVESMKRKIKLDTSKLKEFDLVWQRWILERIPLDIVGRSRLYPNNDKIPKDQWWWWIEELDKLSEEQKSTL